MLPVTYDTPDLLYMYIAHAIPIRIAHLDVYGNWRCRVPITCMFPKDKDNDNNDGDGNDNGNNIDDSNIMDNGGESDNFNSNDNDNDIGDSNRKIDNNHDTDNVNYNANGSRVGVKYGTCTWYLYLSTYLSVLDVLEYLVYRNVKVLVLVLDQKVLGTYK